MFKGCIYILGFIVSRNSRKFLPFKLSNSVNKYLTFNLSNRVLPKCTL